MFQRHSLPLLTDELQHTPAVALLGPRQSGKTTLALEASKTIASIYLDLGVWAAEGKIPMANLRW